MAESVEYEVLICHTVDLQLAVRENLTPLGAQLVSAKIITLNQYREIRNPHRPVDERGADLVEYVQTKVRQDPQHYYVFISALRSNLSQYGSILMKLEQAGLPQALELQPLNPQHPPPTEDGNQLPAQGIMFMFVLVLEIGIASAPPPPSLAQPIALSTFTSWDNSSGLGIALTSMIFQSNPTMSIYYSIFVKSRLCLLSDCFEKFPGKNTVLIPIIACTIDNSVVAAI